MICPAQGFLCREVSPRESRGFLGSRIVSLPQPDSSEETGTVAKSSVARLSHKADDSVPYPCSVPLNTREGNLFSYPGGYYAGIRENGTSFHLVKASRE